MVQILAGVGVGAAAGLFLIPLTVVVMVAAAAIAGFRRIVKTPASGSATAQLPGQA
ncbi:MAG: hypothetical protein QNJ40_03575 [Xanthomonadales bacterium]|nr:hypothetical protein [Xanthomonadales bacterium]